MTLEIVWRNPIPTQKSATSIERVAYDDRVAVYLVSNAETFERFEMILGGAA
jgi:hypothetical protein